MLRKGRVCEQNIERTIMTQTITLALSMCFVQFILT